MILKAKFVHISSLDSNTKVVALFDVYADDEETPRFTNEEVMGYPSEITEKVKARLLKLTQELEILENDLIVGSEVTT